MKIMIIYITVLLFIFSGCKNIETNSEKEVAEAEKIYEDEDENTTNEEAEENASDEVAEVKKEEEILPQNDEKPNENDLEEINTLPNEASGWGFVKKKGQESEFTSGQKEMMEKYSCIYKGSSEEKVMYLTFDEGYENGYTGLILDTLKEKGVKAAFFITGPYLEKNFDLVKRMLDEGHIVGNHTVNHPNMPSLKNAKKMQEEIISLDLKYYETFGVHMSYFRPPEGAYSERSLASTNNLGYKTVLWSFAYKDWETNNQKGASYAYESVVPYFHNGSVILLHAVSKDNTEALGDIIDEAINQGYEFKSLDEFKY